MKNIIKNFGIIYLVAIIGFLMTGCDNGGGDSDGGADPLLNGTWSTEDYEELTFNNGNFEASVEGSPAMKGTYTTSGNNITITITHVWGGHPEFRGYLESKWYSRAEFRAWAVSMNPNIDEARLNRELNEMFTSQTGTYSVNDTTLILEDDEGPTTYTKKS